MTTAATVVGHFPLVLATGPGAGARNSIGIMLVTGMIIGTFFTLFVVPSIYMLLARTHRRRPRAGASVCSAIGRPVTGDRNMKTLHLTYCIRVATASAAVARLASAQRRGGATLSA